MITIPGSVDYAYLRRLVQDQSQNVLDPSHDYLFEIRLACLLRKQEMDQIDELIQLLRAKRNPALERAVAEAMTVNETSFFRDERPFEILRNDLLAPLIQNRREKRTLRFWSAACSTGQEAYSIAMLIHEHFPDLAGWNLRIEGTDISNEVVERARAGRYHRIEISRGLPQRKVVRFFDQSGELWTVKPELRKLCKFRQANLCVGHFPFTEKFDVIFLRNVMLYLSQETRQRLLLKIHRMLASDGLLFLGSSEQPSDPSLWTTTLTGGTCYYRPR